MKPHQPQNIIAVVFDFDETLAPDSTSGLLEAQGVDVREFWKRVAALYLRRLAYQG